jgi:hypothetical protein
MTATIYRIVPKAPMSENDVYYGATTAPLSIRFSKHVYDWKRYLDGRFHVVNSMLLFAKYGIDGCRIEPVCVVCNPADLAILEKTYINNNPCVNRKTISL